MDLFTACLQYNINDILEYIRSGNDTEVSSRHIEIIKSVIQIGTYDGNHCKESLLMEAVCAGSLEIVKILLGHGANINTLSRECDGTPLWMSASKYSFSYDRPNQQTKEIFELLLQHGPTINLDLLQNKGYIHCMFGRFPRSLRSIEKIKQYSKLHSLCEWRPWNHSNYPMSYHNAMKTLVILAKA